MAMQISQSKPSFFSSGWNTLVGFVSPKQLTRPDSLLTCCQEVLPHLMQNFEEQCWKVVFTAKNYVYPTEDAELKTSLIALQAIFDVERNGFSGEALSSEMTGCVGSFLSKPLSDSDYTKINAHLQFSGNDKLWRTLKVCKELFLPIQTNCVKELQTKMTEIGRSLYEPIESPFDAEMRLTPKDLRLLTVAESRRKLLAFLKEKGIACAFHDELMSAWGEMADLNRSAGMAAIRERCATGYKAGQIFFYDWNFIKIKDFYPLDLTWAAKHILFSRIPHLGIIIKDDQDKPQLSHVNGAMGRHGINSMQFPALGALGNLGELDISTLIPKSVASEHQSQLKKMLF